MEHSQRELRRVAEKAFLEALDQLSESITAIEPQLSHPPAMDSPLKPAALPASDPPDLKAWEDAAADIEAFMKSKESQ